VNHNHPVRTSAAFFLVTFSTAFLFTIGVRLTGWFTKMPVIPPQDMSVLGGAIMIAVTCLAIGAFIRRFSALELQCALLGAAAVLFSTPLAQAVLTNEWSITTGAVSGLGLILLLLGVLVAWGRKGSTE
jgi:hypothetical protein